jgi:hypothetical protein
MSNRKKLKLNMRFSKGQVICAKSPDLCKGCKEECEMMEVFYYQYSRKDIEECFKNCERRR